MQRNRGAGINDYATLAVQTSQDLEIWGHALRRMKVKKSEGLKGICVMVYRRNQDRKIVRFYSRRGMSGRMMIRIGMRVD